MTMPAPLAQRRLSHAVVADEPVQNMERQTY